MTIRTSFPTARPAGRARAAAVAVRRVAICLVATTILLAGPAFSTDLFDHGKLRPGLRGQVRTVLSGGQSELIDLEILGVLPDGISPGVDMIFGRLLGDKGAWTGVAAGMSGSPVYVDGQLVGALAYSIGQFAKEPILGITPIRQMLDLQEFPAGLQPWLKTSADLEIRAAPLAIAAPGLSPQALAQLADVWKEIGVDATAVIAPAASTGGPTKTDLQPGDAISALLVWGDMKLGATGTLTWRDGDRVLAFGHPFLGAGRVTLPLASAEIIWTVPSLLNSFKVARIGEPIGVVEQDRLTAIMGKLGQPPAGLPVSISVRRPGRPELRKRYQVARDPFLTPPLVSFVLRTTMLESLGAERDESLRVAGLLKLADGQQLRFTSVAGPGTMSQDQQIGGELAVRLSQLVRPPLPLPDIQSVELVVESAEPLAAWIVRKAMPDRLVVRPGETFRVTAELEGTRGGHRRESLKLTAPRGTPAGAYTLLVGAATALDTELGRVDEVERRTARTAEEYLATLADPPAGDQLQVVLVRTAEGIVVDGREHPALPGSAHLLLRSRPGGAEMYRTRAVVAASASLSLDQPVTEILRVPLEVLPPES